MNSTENIAKKRRSNIFTVRINADSEYAATFGVKKGVYVFLTEPSTARVNNLVLVTIHGKHQLDTFNSFDDYKPNEIVGVLVEDSFDPEVPREEQLN